MYNRYIPQPDGSYRRSRMPEYENPPSRPPQRPHIPQEHHPQPEPEPCQEETPYHQEPHRQEAPKRNPCPRARPRSQRQASYAPPRQEPPKQEYQDRRDGSVGNFLRALLPKDFDTSDLLIVLLLLLMSGDGQEDQNSALLTLALYLFM